MMRRVDAARVRAEVGKIPLYRPGYLQSRSRQDPYRSGAANVEIAPSQSRGALM